MDSETGENYKKGFSVMVKQIGDKPGLIFVPEKNSPPVEGWLKAGVVNFPPVDEWLKAGVVNSPSVKGCPQTGVANSPPVEGNRKGRKLEFDDILHYQRIIIVALSETARILYISNMK